jgi:2-oxoglutarate dehydrogenase E1 component
MRRVLDKLKPQLNLHYIGRKSSAAPASGYMSVHLEEQKRFIDEALYCDN